MDPYLILGIPSSASDAEVRAAFRKKALQWHPDRNANDAHMATLKFKEVTAAYESIQNSRNSPSHSTFPRTSTSSTYQAPRPRYRYTPPSTFHNNWKGGRGPVFSRGLGIGVNVLVTGLAVYGWVWATDYAWRKQNRGKSFDETEEARRKMRENTSRGYYGSRRRWIVEKRREEMERVRREKEREEEVVRGDVDAVKE